jgi:hypothetical protein
MWSLLLVVLAIFVVAGWARSVRAGRLQWLERLSLPGTWRCEDPGTTLELRGALAGGDYVEAWATGMERGQWQLHGHTLTLTATRVPPRDYELRLFSDGEIGIHGPGRERRIYRKQQSNVVPLRRRR